MSVSVDGKVLESDREANQVMKDLDVNHDGKISYEEFIGHQEKQCNMCFFRHEIVAVFVLFVVRRLFGHVELGYLKSGGADDDALEAAERAISKEIITLNRLQNHGGRCCRVGKCNCKGCVRETAVTAECRVNGTPASIKPFAAQYSAQASQGMHAAGHKTTKGFESVTS